MSKALSGPLRGPGRLPERRPPDSVRLREIRDRMDKLSERYVQKVLEVVRTGEPTGVRAEMLRAFAVAARWGHAAAGLPDLELDDVELNWIDALATAEAGYLREWALKAGANPAASRARLYRGGLLSAYQRGFLAAAPSGRIDWVLGVAEHCSGCLALAAGGPYNPPGSPTKPLPTIPGNGDTPCLGNCACHLEVHAPDGLLSLAARVGVEVIGIGGRPIDPRSDAGQAAAALYQRQAELAAFHERSAELDPELRHEHRVYAAAALRQIGSLAQRLGHTVRPSATNAEILEPVDRALSLGLTYVPPRKLTDDLVLLVAGLLAANQAKRGRIKAVHGSTVVMDDGASYRLDAAAEQPWILFLDARGEKE